MTVSSIRIATSNDLEKIQLAAFNNTEDEVNRVLQEVNDRALFPEDTGQTGSGQVVFQTSPELTTPTVTGALQGTGSATFHSGTAPPAGGTAGMGIMLSSVTNLGIFFGSGTPALSAADGSFYIRSDPGAAGTRFYVRQGGAWIGY
jgi:hypothetical protein